MTSDYTDTQTHTEKEIDGEREAAYGETLSHNSKLSATMFAYRLRTGSGFLLSRPAL